MPCQARSMTSWATSSASPRSPSSRSSSMKRRSAYAPDSRSKALTSPAWARATRLASVSAGSGAGWPLAGSGAGWPPGGGIRPAVTGVSRRARRAGPDRRSLRERGRPPGRRGPGPRIPGRASRGCRARNARSPARGGRAGAGRAGAALPRRSARDAAATTGDHRLGRACPSSPLTARGWDRRSHGSRPSPGRPRGSAVLRLVRRRGLEGQRAGVDAVPVPGLGGPVVEDVAQVTAAATADDLGTVHEQAVVRPQLDRLGDRGLGEAGPAGARIELGVRAEQLAAAAGAPVETVLVVVDVLTGERALGVSLAQDAVLQRGQLPAPLLVRLADLPDGGLGTRVGLAHRSVPFLLVHHPVRPAFRPNDFQSSPPASDPGRAHAPGSGA